MNNAALVPACVTVAGLACWALVQWLRTRPRSWPVDCGSAPRTTCLAILAAAGETVAVVAAVLAFILA